MYNKENLEKPVKFKLSFKPEDGGGVYEFTCSSFEFLDHLESTVNGLELCRESSGEIEWNDFIVDLTMKTWSDSSLSGIIIHYNSGKNHYLTFKTPLRAVLANMFWGFDGTLDRS